MNSTFLLQAIVRKISRYKLLIIITGLVLAGVLFFIARRSKTEYTSKATIFPLTNPSDNSLASGALSSLLGGGESSKSFSSEASINIIELALSRNVRETLAGTRIPVKGYKTVAQLMVEEQNKGRSFLSKEIEFPADSVEQVVIGSRLLLPNIMAKINKNDVLELNFTSTDASLVTPISKALIAVISQFYINLRIAKAQADYNFTLGKIDSLQSVINDLDSKAIQMQNRTQFTSGERLEYAIPRDNLGEEKLRIGRERDININNREEALWRLQKITPIIATLDQPTPPFDIEKPSSILYGIIGFIVGCLMAIFFAIAGLLYRFAKAEAHKTVFGTEASS